MNDTLRQQLIERLKQEGADLIRFGNADRFDDPALRTIFPEVRTVIGIAFRQLRGSRRGIEEGSTYYQYSTTALETIEEVVIPMALLRGAALLEEAGFEVLPQRRNQTIRNDADGTNFEVDYHEIYRGVKAENQLDFERCAVASGLGESGLSGSLLTDEFGPFQRVAFLLTDAEFVADPVVKPHLCDHCGACVRECPGHALSADGKRDEWQCAAYYAGASRANNPFMPPDAFPKDPERLKVMTGEADLTREHAKKVLDDIHFYPPMKHAYPVCVCGRRCDTACYVHLEEKGILTRKFNAPFRKRPAWMLSPLEGVDK